MRCSVYILYLNFQMEYSSGLFLCVCVCVFVFVCLFVLFVCLFVFCLAVRIKGS